MVLWVIVGLTLLVALVTLALARRTSRKLEALTQSYWELRYDYTRLRSQVQRLDPEVDETPPPASAAPSKVTFVSLSSMKKKNE